MGLDNGGVYGKLVKFGFETQYPEDVIKDAVLNAFLEAAVQNSMNHSTIAENGRKSECG